MKKIKRGYKVVAAFFSCLVVAASTLGISMRFSQKELREEAFRIAQMEAGTENLYANIIFQSTEWVMNSFLVSFADVEKVGEEDKVFKYKRILRERDSRKMEVDELQEMVDAFVSYNNELYSCILIFEPGALINAPNGVAIAAYSDGRKEKELLSKYNLLDSPFYKQIDAVEEGQLKVGNIRENELLVVTLGVPIFNSKGETIGQCWIDLVMDKLSKMISAFKFKNDVATFIMSIDGRVICSSDIQYNGQYLKNILLNKYPGCFPQDWYNQMTEKMADIEQKNDVFSAKIDGIMTKTYYNRIRGTGFMLVTIKLESDIIRLANELQIQLMQIFVGAFLLFAFCLLYLFYAFRKENKAKDKLQNDLELAYQIQHSLLPPNPEVFPKLFGVYGYQRTAKSVGGDLYSYFVKGDKLHFCIGDVSGKGVPAALLMAEIISLYRYIAKTNDDIVEIIKALNRSSMDSSVNRNICTMFVGILDLKSGRLDFCNAGHNPPVLLSGGEADYIKMKANMPLYAFDDYPYVAESIGLKPGDKMFFYTDGLTDAMNSKQEMFGQQELLNVLSNNGQKNFNKVVNSVLTAISEFVGKVSQYDDITMLCIKYKGDK